MERYKIQKRIGKGSFGSVFLVTDLETQRDAVVKRVPLVELSDKERGQAKLEVQLMQSLAHAFLVSHIDSFLFNGEDLVIVMDHYAGGDLGSFLSSRSNGEYLTETQVVFIVAQLSLGLQFMHSRRVLHRDIKAQNVFLHSKYVDEETNVLHVVIGDLGIAKVLGKTLDMAKTAIGTPLYMSPEVCEGEQYSYSSDIWSLGCVFYELCALNHPFQSRDLSGLVMKIITANYAPLPPDVKLSKPYRDMMKGMLSKNQRKRPSADDILQSKHFRKRAVELARFSPQNTDELQEQLISLGIVDAYSAQPPRRPSHFASEGTPANPQKGRMPTPPPSDDTTSIRTHLLDRYTKKKNVEDELERLKATQRTPLSSALTPPQPQGLSAKERVLKQKREREQKREEERLIELDKARSNAHQQRIDAKEAGYAMYHNKRSGSNASTPTASGNRGSNAISTSSAPPDIHSLTEGELDHRISEYEDEVALYRKQIGEILCKLDDPRLFESSPSSSPPPEPSDPFEDVPSSSYNPRWGDDDRERQTRESTVISGLSEKIRALRSRLEASLSPEILHEAYHYIKDRNPQDDASPDFYPALRQLLPEEKVHLWVEIDQLIFMESSFGV